MAKVQGVTVYRDEAGEEHDTAEQAERANEVIAATNALRIAAQAVSRAYLNTAVTGDGRQFEDVASGHYWEVHRYSNCRPYMRRVWIWPHACDVASDGHGVIYRCEHRGEEGAEQVRVRIGNLYSTDETARARYVELFREYAAEVAAELHEMTKGGA